MESEVLEKKESEAKVIYINVTTDFVVARSV